MVDVSGLFEICIGSIALQGSCSRLGIGYHDKVDVMFSLVCLLCSSCLTQDRYIAAGKHHANLIRMPSAQATTLHFALSKVRTRPKQHYKEDHLPQRRLHLTLYEDDRSKRHLR